MKDIKLIDICDRCTMDGVLWNSKVVQFTPNKAQSSLTLTLSCPTLVLPQGIEQVEGEIAKVYRLSDVKVKVEFSSTKILADDACKISQFIGQKYPTIGSAIKDDSVEPTDSGILLKMPKDWVFRVENLRSDIESSIAEWLGYSIHIELVECENRDKDYHQLRSEEITRIEKEAAEQAAQVVVPAQQKPTEKTDWRKKRDPNAVTYKPEDSNVLYGKPLTRQLIHVADLRPDGDKVTVQGKIFFRDHRVLNGRGKTVVTFDMYDGTGSVRVIKLVPDDEAEGYRGAIKKATCVTVQGVVSYSEFEKDLIITPTAIMSEKEVVRRDNCKDKRVELHLHTVMSAMDGFCDTKAAVKLAASMGHRAIAITDHGVAQAFPDAMNAYFDIAKEYPDFKVLYGIENYAVNDLGGGGAVKGFSTAGLNDEIVVFDLETTGLSPRNCQIIEIAAVILKDGKEISEYHSYIKPTQLIPSEITQLTGITDRDVANAPPMEQVVPEFMAYIGGRPVVAHNADFDVNFMKAACEKLGTQGDFVSIDTVTIAKLLLPNLKRHKLNTVAEHYGFNFNHHRALDDTKVLAQIVLKFWQIFASNGVDSVDQINGYLAGLSGGGSTAVQNSNHMVILVKNLVGLRNLYEMISHAHLKYFKRNPRMPMSMITKLREGLIIGSACEAGELYSAVVRGAVWDELVKIATFYDYLEIQPATNNLFMIEKGMARDLEQIREFNRTIVKLGEQLNKPVVATGDVHFLEPADSYFREIMMTGMGFSDAANQAPLYFKTTQEMLDEFSYLGADKAYEVVVKNPNMIADMCDNIRPVPKEQFPPHIDHAAEDIEEMCRNRVADIYGENPPEIVVKRLKEELDSIIGNGFSVMYITAQKLVAKSMEDGYLVGSRGSVGSSFVAYLTGITEVNSLPPHYICPKCKWCEFDLSGKFGCGADMPERGCPECGEALRKDGFNIYFAVFLGFEGDKTPDIDLNFSGEYQARAHRETINIFGEENVFRAGTIGTIKDKTAFGFVKKYLEKKGENPNRAEENRLVQGCTGIKRTTGQHPGGLMVVPREVSIYDFTPVQRPADDTDTDIITTHFDYHSIHDNLLKLDLLGHDDPTMIKVLEDLTGLHAGDIPLDDPETMGIFTDISYIKDKNGEPLPSNDTVLGDIGSVAIPEFGTRFVRQMLKDTQPKNFDGLCRISGLSHGTNVWLNNAQDFIRGGQATLKDVVSVRDDILVYLLSVGLEAKTAFTIMESVRKGKGLKPEWVEAMKEKNVPEWYIVSCKKISYLFPRAHAVAYVMMAFRIAWFKVHQPMAFYSAYFSIRAKGFDASVMTVGDDVVLKKIRSIMEKEKRTGAEEDMLITLETCHEFYKRGFRFQGVNIYKSQAENFVIDGDTLIAPLTSLPGVGLAAAEDIIAEREGEMFMSTEDIILRCPKVTKGVAEALENIGATGDIPKTNQISLF